MSRPLVDLESVLLSLAPSAPDLEAQETVFKAVEIVHGSREEEEKAD